MNSKIKSLAAKKRIVPNHVAFHAGVALGILYFTLAR